MEGRSLTPTSYVVLGLVATLGDCTSYDMKRVVSGSIGYFWTFPHSQLYAEPIRLVDLGLLEEDQEAHGRKRRHYRITDAGRRALEEWVTEPTDEPTEIRDLAILKLFFGSAADPADVVAVAKRAGDAHRRRLADYEAIAAGHRGDRHHRLTLEMGLRYERAAVAFWDEVAKEP